MQKLFKKIIAPRSGIRYHIIRVYFISLFALAIIWLMGRLLVSQLTDEISQDNRLYYRVTHQLTHTAGLKEHLHILSDHGGNAHTLMAAEERKCYADFVIAFQNNHRLLLTNYEVQKSYLGIAEEAYLSPAISTAHLLYQKIGPELMRFQRQQHWELAETAKVLELISQYEVQLHNIVHSHFKDLESDFEMLSSWITFFLVGFFFVSGIAISLFVVRPAIVRLGAYMLENLQSHRKINQINRELSRTNQELLTTHQLLQIEQERSFKALQDKLALAIEQEKISTTYLILGQEEERKRISQELHDSIGQMLTGIKYGLEKLNCQLTSKQIPKLQTAKHLLQLIDQTIEEIRRILIGLVPSTLEAFGIVVAINSLIDTLQAQHPHVHFQFFQPEGFSDAFTSAGLPNGVSLGIIRIVQEAIHNALKHAQPTEILVELENDEEHLVLRISDDGIGFDSTKLWQSKQTKFGIENMRKRSEILGAQFHLESILNQGTEIQVFIPKALF